MIVDPVSSQNIQKHRRRRSKQPCQVARCSNNAKDEINITTKLYGLARLNVCKKCKKVFESSQIKKNLNTNRKTVEDHETVIDICTRKLEEIDWDDRSYRW
jgi:hypothetical protein